MISSNLYIGKKMRTVSWICLRNRWERRWSFRAFIFVITCLYGGVPVRWSRSFPYVRRRASESVTWGICVCWWIGLGKRVNVSSRCFLWTTRRRRIPVPISILIAPFRFTPFIRCISACPIWESWQIRKRRPFLPGNRQSWTDWMPSITNRRFDISWNIAGNTSGRRARRSCPPLNIGSFSRKTSPGWCLMPPIATCVTCTGLPTSRNGKRTPYSIRTLFVNFVPWEARHIRKYLSCISCNMSCIPSLRAFPIMPARTGSCWKAICL